MSTRSGHRSRSRSGSRSRSPSRGSSRRGNRREDERPWLRRSRSRSGSRSRSRSPRFRSRRSRSGSPPVRPVMSKDPKHVNARVFVANLASDKTTSSELLAVFETHGKVLDTLVHHNGYGFVQFSTEEEGRKAVAAENGTMFHGKKIKCNMAAEGKKGGGAGRGGPHPADRMPPDNRFGRELSPRREPFPPPPFDDPYLRGRDLPPPRDLLPPPRDPYFDDPYRRAPPPDPYFDRFRDDPYRRDPYLDPYRDPYRDPYPASLYDAPAPPKKPVAVDCEIIVMDATLRRYADMVEHRLRDINLLTNIVVMREDRTVQQQVEDATRRSCLFAIVINSQNEIHRSLTLNILHGVAQEHRNMPMDDALSLVGRSFEKFLQAEKDKVAALAKGGAPEMGPLAAAGAFVPPPKEVAYLLNLLADNRQVTVDELDKVIAYLKERKAKLLQFESPQPQAQPPARMPEGQGQPSHMDASIAKAPVVDPALQQQQYQQQQQQQQQKQQHQELQNKILSMMNGSPTATVPSGLAMTHNTMATHAAPLMPAASCARPPPPPPPQQAVGGMLGAAATSPPSVGAVQGGAQTATLINFDNPTVQKALDNLIQSGPNLLRNISVSQPGAGFQPPLPQQRPPY